LTGLVSAQEDIYLRKPFAVAVRGEPLADAFGIDSFGKINLFYAVIDDLGLDLPETAAEPWQTLDDVLLFIRQQLAAGA